jgi:hypothetical protein
MTKHIHFVLHLVLEGGKGTEERRGRGRKRIKEVEEDMQ